MLCPNCGSNAKAAVLETRKAAEGGIRRRRRCADCFHDFETVERVNAERLQVQKSDGGVELFDRNKVRRGIIKAAVRQHHADQLLEVIESIVLAVHKAATNERVSSRDVSDVVLSHLKDFDPVTHVRYALTQLGRRDQRPGGRNGWKGVKEFRRWLESEYPEATARSHASARIAVVVKKDGRREPFDIRKLERSIGVASKGRGPSDGSVRDLATRLAESVEHELSHQTVVTSGQLAAEILRGLRSLDPLAAIRFASTMKRFVSVEDYEIEALGLR